MIAMWSCRRRGAAGEGQMLAIFAVTLAAMLAVTGLVIDGGIMFQSYRRAYHLADGAARAAADELSAPAFREGVIALDPAAAGATVAAWLAPETGTVRVLASPDTGRLDLVEVTVTREAPTHFLRVVGVPTWRARATVTHELRFAP